MKVFKILLIIGLLITSFSCTEEFLENPPPTTVTDQTYPENANDALLVTNAAYHNLRNWWYMGGYPLVNIMSDDQTKGSEDGSNPDLQQFEEFTFTASHQYILAWYQTLYETIKYTNVVVNKVPDIQMDPDLKERYIAEAKFIRAYTYFNLVRLFGAVPKVTTVYPDRFIPWTPVEEIYEDIIIPDLMDGVEVLPLKSEYDPEDIGRVTKGAAKALLARVYLYRGDFENTEKYALEVINSGQYSLNSSFKNVFADDNNHGTGSVFELGALPIGNLRLGGNQYGNTQGVRGTPNWGWGFGRPSWDILTSFETGDPRRDASVIFLGEVVGGTVIEGNDNTTDTTYNDQGEIVEIECYNQKVSMNGSEDVQDNFGYNRKIIRYADVLLMAAEALNENGKPSEALTYLNMVRERARDGNNSVLPDITETDKQQLRQIIWKERRFELAFENLRYFDLQRQDRMDEVLGPLGFTEGKNELLPIPQQEIDLTEGKMSQNPNW